jgi:hypothetical protein
MRGKWMTQTSPTKATFGAAIICAGHHLPCHREQTTTGSDEGNTSKAK